MHDKVTGTLFPLISHLVYHNSIFGLKAIKSYLEIGVSDGFSLHLMLQEHDLDELILCDTWGEESGGTGKGNHNHIVALLEEEGFPLENVTFLDGDSKILIPQYFNLHPQKMFDLCFVDGDHSASGCLADLKAVIDHASIIVVHDLRNPAHQYLREVVYQFYETVRMQFVFMDDGEDLGILFRKELF